jgi:hypothetical protein
MAKLSNCYLTEPVIMKYTFFISLSFDWIVVPFVNNLSVDFIRILTISKVGKLENNGQSVNTSLNLMSVSSKS